MLRLLACLLALGLCPLPVRAHPMGNFTISHYSELAVAPEVVRLYYVLDLAEIPTLQERQKMDRDADGHVSRGESDTYLRQAARVLPPGLALQVNGARVRLAVRSAEIAFPAGAGNLPTMKLRLRLEAALPREAARAALTYADTHYRARAGWKELVVRAASGARIVETNAPATSLSHALAAYPADLLNAPPQQTEARAVLALAAPTGPAAEQANRRSDNLTSAAQSGTGQGGKRFASRFTELLAVRRLTWPILLVSLLAAFGFGAAHALEPGHGKTVVAAYLVGSRGTPRHALWLGLIVTLTHTLGVFALGLLTLFASAYVVPDRLYPWIGAFSGLAITGVGLTLLGRHLRHGHAHAHGLPHDHPHDHDHPHGHGPQHHHHHGPSHHHSHDYEEVLGAGGVRFGSLLALGISGGIVPCPGALVVLLAAVAMHRVGFGLALIVAFSMGLATVLTGIGLLMVSARGFLDRVPGLETGRWSERLSVLSAAVVSLLGLGIAVQALAPIGLLRFPV